EAWGFYLLFRVFCAKQEDVLGLTRALAIALVPVAVAMLVERLTGRNEFALFGGASWMSAVRQGVVRAQGPFAHPILAGSIGAVCAPLMAGLWPRHRPAAVAGVGACSLMVVTSGSS